MIYETKLPIYFSSMHNKSSRIWNQKFNKPCTQRSFPLFTLKFNLPKLYIRSRNRLKSERAKPAFKGSKLAIETQEPDVKYVQSQQ